MGTTKLSPSTYQRLQTELDDLKTRGRVDIARAIEAARALGDLSENGDYHAAKDEQGHMEARIRQIEAILENHEIVEGTSDGTVAVGCIVTILYEGDSPDQAERYLIGHMEEKPVDPSVQVMSPTSPLGAALLGSAAGNKVKYKAPNGTLSVSVVRVEPNA